MLNLYLLVLLSDARRLGRKKMIAVDAIQIATSRLQNNLLSATRAPTTNGTPAPATRRIVNKS